MPVCFYIYFCQQLDKSSVSFAANFGLREDTNLTGSEYSWLSSIVYFAQLIFQPCELICYPARSGNVCQQGMGDEDGADDSVSIYALVKFPVNWWIVFCFFGWATSCMICAAFTSFTGLIIFRFVLGAFEASISPCMMLIVSQWWTRREQPLRNK